MTFQNQNQKVCLVYCLQWMYARFNGEKGRKDIRNFSVNMALKGTQSDSALEEGDCGR